MDGLPGRGTPPGRDRAVDGDAGLATLLDKRESCAGCGGAADSGFADSRLSGELGPATRRSLSSS